jgi:hypothetical protein
MHMSNSVGVTELRQLGPAPSTGPDLDRLIAEGRVSRPLRSGLPEALDLTGNPDALSHALEDIRGDRFAASWS